MLALHGHHDLSCYSGVTHLSHQEEVTDSSATGKLKGAISVASYSYTLIVVNLFSVFKDDSRNSAQGIAPSRDLGPPHTEESLSLSKHALAVARSMIGREAAG